jgi:hypothetical protein
MRPHQNKKMIAGLVSAVGAAVLALCLLTAGAVAAPNPGPGSDGPQSANIPYVAWVGEHVRLVVCDPAITTGDEAQVANYQVEDWSGYQFQPPTPDGDSGSSIGQIFDPGPAAFFRSSEAAHRIGESDEQEGCVATDYKSLNPGLTRIRVDVRSEETGAIVFSHQFLAIWLTANKPTLAEAGLSNNVNADGSTGDNTFQSQLNGSGQSNLSKFLGDPSGNGEFSPSPFDPTTAPNEDKGLVQIKVTGSFPVVAESPLSNILPNSSYTLPSDWTTLAETLSSSSEETEPPGSNPMLWDIHGTPSEATTSNAGSATNDPLHDVFFRPAFSSFTSGETATVGPFDPQAANETLLSDGRINADDAPMPALRVDVSIAANEGGTDLGGVGQISGASKAQIYSHDFTGNAEAEGNLYNPYYGAYIPATDRPVSEASGVTGPSPGGSFPGFLNAHPSPYTFWTSVHSANDRSSSSTGCLRRAPGLSTEATSEDDYQTPSGPRTETFYTDERGEAYVTYTPGDGFYLNQIPSITTDANGGCDLESLFGKEIGHSSITAKAVYPYEPVDYPPITSEPLVKKVNSLWLKEIYEFPKGTSPSDQNVRIVVAKAQDIDGRPFVGETVCFHAQQEASVSQFLGSVVDTKGVLGQGEGTTVSLSGTSVVPSPTPSEGEFCETTNSQGLAGIEMQNSSFPAVDLTTFYANEGITRDNSIDFSTNAAGAKEAEEKKKAEEAKAAEEKKKAEEAKAAEEAKKVEEKKKAEETREAAEKKDQEEEAAKNEARAAEEAAKQKVREEEVAAKKITEEEANKEKAAEKVANEEKAAAEAKTHKEEIEKLTAEVEKLAKTAATTTVASSDGSLPPLLTSIPSPISLSDVAGSGVKSSKVHKAKVAKHSKKKGKKSSKKGKKGKSKKK